ncbi:MAG: hypothetical protein J6J23_07805 [Clostridia bacterium]|nr:hypothetical protein [Clostridia bacterium]
MLIPKHKENLIVGITYLQKFNWYILPSTTALLCLDKLKPSIKNYYMSHSAYRKMREDCQTLATSQEVEEYIKAINPFIISCEQLSNMLAHASRGKTDFANDFCPSLYFNFDTKEMFYSDKNYENHALCSPAGFKTYLKNFLNIIPNKQQFWKLI